MTTGGISQSSADNRADQSTSSRLGLLHCHLLVGTDLARHRDLLHHRGSGDYACNIYGKRWTTDACTACGN
jgi:hypothetical protein